MLNGLLNTSVARSFFILNIQVHITILLELKTKLPQRITIKIGDRLAKRLRNIQAEMIKDSKSSVSISKVISEILEKGLKID